jgi:hypothetical protein
MVGSVCRVKLFTAEWLTFCWWRGWNGGAEVAETTVKRILCCGVSTLVKRWDKCINVSGGYVKKWIFFNGRISHVLRFISICDLFTDYVRFDVFTAVTMKNVFWANRRFGGTYCLHYHGRKIRARGTSVSRLLQTKPPVGNHQLYIVIYSLVTVSCRLETLS